MNDGIPIRDGSIGFSMRISVLEWSALGRRRLTDFILRRLRAHKAEEFGAQGYQLGFFIEVERSTSPQGKGKEVFRNAYYEKEMMAFCSFKIWRDEVFLPEEEFKRILAQRFVEASCYFCKFFQKKVSSFKSEKYIEFIKGEMNVFLDSVIDQVLTEEELKIVRFRTGIE